MFKVGDKVRYCHPVCYWEGIRLDPPNEVGLVLGNIYTVTGRRGNSDIELENIVCSYCVARFELVEEAPKVSNNPAIEEYTKTVTVRKLRANTFPISFDSELKVIPSKNTVTLRFGNNRNGYGAKLKANELRALAKQLTEIADVMDENDPSS